MRLISDPPREHLGGEVNRKLSFLSYQPSADEESTHLIFLIILSSKNIVNERNAIVCQRYLVNDNDIKREKKEKFHMGIWNKTRGLK